MSILNMSRRALVDKRIDAHFTGTHRAQEWVDFLIQEADTKLSNELPGNFEEVTAANDAL